MIRLRLLALGVTGAPCCPDCFGARRLVVVDVELQGAPTTDALRAQDEARATGRLLARLRVRASRGAWAAFLESFEGGLLCEHSSPVEKASLVERLRAGTIWS